MSKVLVVEDDRVARELLAEILRADGLTVTALASGDEAVSEAGKRSFDLVISDIRMGDGATGMDVLAAFTAKAPKTPVILITAFGDVSGAMAAIQKGAHDYVSKPFDVAQLTTTVRRALEPAMAPTRRGSRASSVARAPCSRCTRWSRAWRRRCRRCW